MQKEIQSKREYPNKYPKASDSVRYVKGVGPRLAEMFAKKGILTLRDLVYFYPRTYRDQRLVHDLSSLSAGAYVTLYATVVGKKILRLRGKTHIYEVSLQSAVGLIRCKYFRLPYRGYFDSIEIDEKVKVVGRVNYYRNHPEFHHPDIYPFQKNEVQEDKLVPIYSEIENISQNKIRNTISQVFSYLKQDPAFLASDPLPDWVRKENNLMDKISALEQIHEPNQKYIEEYLKFRTPAQKRLIFEEFFLLQLYMGMKKTQLEKEQSQAIAPTFSLMKKLKKSLPFALTSAQNNVLKEISEDLKNNWPMHRLIQGDVGCGKTIVAFLASCQAMENRFQCAMMVPTEILAEQHYQRALSLLKPLGVHVNLLTSKLKAREKRDVLEKLESGYTSFCIGTHALIQESVQFKNLGLVIVDEQHRFGVHQRALLKGKGMHPHFLVMTATPIPRSLAMTLYGDLDVSVIDEMPEGRQPILTKKIYSSKKERVFQFLESKIREGRQAYVVYPLVEESEFMDLKNASDEYEKLKKRFSEFRVGLVHGKMSFFEKTEVMSQFMKKEISILVSTTVIEVGVDVSNASVMIVENAERFGLSQLHQLRGRVGRGEHKSYCILVLSGGISEEALQRISIMEKTNDGFKIAEEDLEMRGPGEFLGTKQSGLPEFKVANLVRDGQILSQAKKTALRLLQKDPQLASVESQLLKKEMERISSRLLPG